MPESFAEADRSRQWDSCVERHHTQPECTHFRGLGSAGLSLFGAAVTDSAWMTCQKQKCISGSSEDGKVQDQDACRLGVCCGTLVSVSKMVSSIQRH